MEDNQRGIPRRLAAKPNEIVAQQIALHDTRPEGRGDAEGGPQIGGPFRLLRPDERFQPCGLFPVRGRAVET